MTRGALVLIALSGAAVFLSSSWIGSALAVVLPGAAVLGLSRVRMLRIRAAQSSGEASIHGFTDSWRGTFCRLDVDAHAITCHHGRLIQWTLPLSFLRTAGIAEGVIGDHLILESVNNGTTSYRTIRSLRCDRIAAALGAHGIPLERNPKDVRISLWLVAALLFMAMGLSGAALTASAARDIAAFQSAPACPDNTQRNCVVAVSGRVIPYAWPDLTIATGDLLDGRTVTKISDQPYIVRAGNDVTLDWYNGRLIDIHSDIGTTYPDSSPYMSRHDTLWWWGMVGGSLLAGVWLLVLFDRNAWAEVAAPRRQRTMVTA